jgi:hypothetical protein
MYVDNKIITLYSQYSVKNNGTYNSDVVFNFNSVLSEDETFIRAYISVTNAQIPSSFYIINETNNVLVYNYIDTTVRTITLTKGNYNATNIISEIQSKLTIAGTPITITIDKITGKLLFSQYGTTISFYQNPLSSLLGLFTESSVLTSTTISDALGVINAPYPLNLLGVKQLLIKSSALCISSYDSRTLGLNDAIVSIPCNSAPFGLILFESQTDLDKHLLISNSIEQIDIRISDEHDNLINFNNVNWCITIALSIERRDFPDSRDIQLLPYVNSLVEKEPEKEVKEPVDEELQLLESN